MITEEQTDVIGYHNDGTPVLEPVADAPIWTIQIRKQINRPPEQGKAARMGWTVLVYLEEQPWGAPDVGLLTDFGIGFYEWRMRTGGTGKGWGNREIHLVEKGEFAGVPESYPMSGRFHITANDIRRHRSIDDEEEDPDPKVIKGPELQRVSEREPKLDADAIRTMIESAIGRRQSDGSHSPAPQDLGATIAAALEAGLSKERHRDLGAEVAALRETVGNLKEQKASSAAVETLRGEFDTFATTALRDIGSVTELSREVSELGKKLEGLRQALNTLEKSGDLLNQIEKLEKVRSALGLERRGSGGDGTVTGRTGIDAITEIAAKGVDLFDHVAAAKGWTDPASVSKAPSGETSAMNWATFQGGKYQHVGPWLDRLADDLSGSHVPPLLHLATDAVVRLSPYPKECEIVENASADDIRKLLTHAKGKRHPLLANWEARGVEDWIEAFKAMFSQRLTKLRAAEQANRDKANDDESGRRRLQEQREKERAADEERAAEAEREEAERVRLEAGGRELTIEEIGAKPVSALTPEELERLVAHHEATKSKSNGQTTLTLVDPPNGEHDPDSSSGGNVDDSGKTPKSTKRAKQPKRAGRSAAPAGGAKPKP